MESLGIETRSTRDSSDYEMIRLPVPGSAESQHKHDFSDDETELDVERERKKQRAHDVISKFDCTGKQAYLGACKMFGVIPCSYFMRNSKAEGLRMKHRSLGPCGIKALCVALVSNTTIEFLDIEDNGIEAQGAVYIADILKENCFISDLNLSGNNIGWEGAKSLFDAIALTDTLMKLDVSKNNICDRAVASISETLLDNFKLTHLNLSHNKFGELAGIELGKAMAVNASLLSLDISSNNLRTKGSQVFLQGLKKNNTLTRINFSHNGVGIEAAADLAKLLKDHKTLEEVDVTDCRIPLQGALLIARALRLNNNGILTTVRLGHNIFGAQGVQLILQGISKNQNTSLKFISFEKVRINKKTADLQRIIEETQRLLIRHDGVEEGWRWKKAEYVPAREALYFMTDGELGALLSQLNNRDHKLMVTLNELEKVLTKEEMWQSRQREIIKRLENSVTRGRIDFSELMDQLGQ